MFQVRKYASIQKGILIISLQLRSGFYEFLSSLVAFVFCKILYESASHFLRGKS